MQIPKDQILALLRDRGQHDQADKAQNELPDQVDTDKHADLLSRFGLDPQELISKYGGQIAGGITGKLGL
jgi:hypothetical protein